MKTETRIAMLQIGFAGVLFATFLGFVVMAMSETEGLGGVFVPLLMALFAVPYFIAEYDMYFNLRYFLLGRDGRRVYKDVLNGISGALSAVIVISFPCCIALNVSAFFGFDAMWIWLGCYVVFRIVYGIVGLIVRHKERVECDSFEM